MENVAALRELTAALARVLGWDKGQTSVTVHSDKTVIVCNENRRAELIAQRQRLLAAEKPASGRTVDVAVRLQHKKSQIAFFGFDRLVFIKFVS